MIITALAARRRARVLLIVPEDAGDGAEKTSAVDIVAASPGRPGAFELAAVRREFKIALPARFRGIVHLKGEIVVQAPHGVK